MRETPSLRGSLRELQDLLDTAEIPDIVSGVNEIIGRFNTTITRLSFTKNFDGFLEEDLKIPATSTVRIQHFLGVKPKWRIVLRQEGNGLITDIPSEWNDKYITLKNNGAVEVIISVLIVRE